MVTNRRCATCGIDISERHYNCTRCEECQKEYRRWVNGQCKTKAKIITTGTRNIEPHRNKNFIQEHQIILQELRHLGLRPGKKGHCTIADRVGNARYKKYVSNKKVN